MIAFDGGAVAPVNFLDHLRRRSEAPAWQSLVDSDRNWLDDIGCTMSTTIDPPRARSVPPDTTSETTCHSRHHLVSRGTQTSLFTSGRYVKLRFLPS